MADATIYEARRKELGAARMALMQADTPEAKVEAATRLLRILGDIAANAPTTELQQRWLEEYRKLQPQVASLRTQLAGNDQPAAALQALDKFSDAVLGFSGEVLEGAGSLATGIGATVKAAPYLLALALVLVALVLWKLAPQLLGKNR